MNAAPRTNPHRMFRITYANVEKDEAPKLYRSRDGMAFDELAAALAPDHAYATTIFFYPHDGRPLADFPALAPSDLLVLATRPPLDDPEGRDDPKRFGPRKIILRNDSELERCLFKAARKFIKYGTRKRIQLTGQAKKLLRPEFRRTMGYIEFYENRGMGHEYFGAQIQRHFIGPGHEPVKPEDSRPSTVGFLIRENLIPGADCDLILSFGLDGYSTLIWNRIVRMRHPEWLQNRGFLMAELVFKKPVPEKPLTPEFADDPDLIEVRLLTHFSAPRAHAPTRPARSSPPATD
jgi:hypothetical protein